MKRFILTVLVTSTSFGLISVAGAEEDDSNTEAKAAYCETCTANQENNDLLTMEARQKRRDEAAALTGDGAAGKKGDEQGTGTGH